MNENIQNILANYTPSVKFQLASKLSGAGDNARSAEDCWSTVNSLQDMFYSMFTGTDSEGNPVAGPQVSINRLPDFLGNLSDALQEVDLVPLFEEATQKVLKRAKQPALFLQNEVATRVPVGPNQTSVEIINLGAITADWVNQSGEYPMAKPDAQVASTSFKVRKAGLQLALTEEAIQASNLGLIELHMGMMSDAIARFVETQLKSKLDAGTTLYDNELENTTYHTRGVDASGNANYTLDHRDIMDMVATLRARGYEATHLLGHPMAWAVLTQDPVMKAQFFHGGSFGTNFWNAAPQFDSPVPLPYGLQHVMYYAMDMTNTATTLTDTGSTLPAAHLTSFYAIDSNNALWLAERGAVSVDQMTDWFKDASVMKIKKYFDTATKDNGRAIVKALNIRVAENYQALFTVRTL